MLLIYQTNIMNVMNNLLILELIIPPQVKERLQRHKEPKYFFSTGIREHLHNATDL